MKGIKHPRHEADHMGSFTLSSCPQYAFMAWCSIQVSFTLYSYSNMKLLDTSTENKCVSLYYHQGHKV
jgi:hypothetical protein